MSEPIFAVRRSQTVSEVIDGEAIVINMETGVYYSLSRSGVAVWERLKDGATAREIEQEIRERHDNVPEQLSAIVSALITQLVTEGLVIESREPAPAKARQGPASAPGSRSPYEKPTLERYTDMQEFLLVDPIHEVTEEGWPHEKAP